MEFVPSLYNQVDCLFLPSLLESFSGTYVEAMYYGLPIATSNLPFATSVCSDSAVYFDPLDCKDIFSCLNLISGSQEIARKCTTRGKTILASYPTWKENYIKFTDHFNNTLFSRECND